MSIGRRPALLLTFLSLFLSLPGLPHLQDAAAKRFAPGVQREPGPSSLDTLVRQIRYPELEEQLPNAKLSPLERSYFEGILADHTNHVAEAIRLLEKVLPALKASDPPRAAVALRTLAIDYFKAGRYRDSCAASRELLDRFAAQFTRAEQQDIQDDLRTFELIRDAVPQTVSGSRSFRVLWRRDALGDIDVPLEAGPVETWWIFDTGANVSTISLTTAHRLGLTLSGGQASTQSGATGTEIALRMAVIPQLKFGAAVLRNVVVQVALDKDLNIDMGDAGRYQIDGILGYPVLEALGSFTVSNDHQMTVAPRSEASPRSERLYLEELTPLLEVATAKSRGLLFGFDTGANSSSFSVAYLRRFPRDFSALAATPYMASGAGGMRKMTAYHLSTIELRLGSARATLKNVPVLAGEIGSDPHDRVLGNLGQDLLGQFETYTIDFREMRLVLGNPRKIPLANVR